MYYEWKRDILAPKLCCILIWTVVGQITMLIVESEYNGVFFMFPKFLHIGKDIINRVVRRCVFAEALRYTCDYATELAKDERAIGRRRLNLYFSCRLDLVPYS